MKLCGWKTRAMFHPYNLIHEAHPARPAPGGRWVQWVLYNLPPTIDALPEGVNQTAALRELGGAWQGLNSGKRTGYSGPCPPPGGPHRYFFKLYALDPLLKLAANATKADVERPTARHTLSP